VDKVNWEGRRVVGSRGPVAVPFNTITYLLQSAILVFVLYDVVLHEVTWCSVLF